jgi:serine protease Do
MFAGNDRNCRSLIQPMERAMSDPSKFGNNNAITGRPRVKRAALATTAIVAVSLAVFGVARGFDVQPVRAETTPTSSLAQSAYPASFAPLVQNVAPAVINVSTEQKMGAADVSEQGEVPQFPPGSPSNDFFKHYFDQMNPKMHGNEKVRSLGSGFIVDPSGYVVTNNHVVSDAVSIKVIMSDGKEYPAKLVGKDARTDLALLKIDAGHPLPFVQFGNSDKAKVGDWVVAVGNPFGLGGTVTAGIVSARGRDLNSGPFDDYLQVDAPINRGNSGGPLFNTAGQVIGVNSAIISPNGGSVGVGFSIPSNMVQPIVAQLKTNGKVERGWLGVQIQKVTPGIAQGLGLDKPRGALVDVITPDAPAAKAGLKQGDVILSYDGHDVASEHDLPRLVANTGPDKVVDMTVWRGDHEVPLKVTIGLLRDDQQQAASGEESGKSSEGAYGLAMSALNDQTRERFGIGDDVHGVLIVGVRDGGPAAEQGLQAGDVIQKVDGQKVSTPAQVKHDLEHQTGPSKKTALILINRKGSDLFMALDLATS